jgi:hypothetical protein
MKSAFREGGEGLPIIKKKKKSIKTIKSKIRSIKENILRINDNKNIKKEIELQLSGAGAGGGEQYFQNQ